MSHHEEYSEAPVPQDTYILNGAAYQTASFLEHALEATPRGQSHLKVEAAAHGMTTEQVSAALRDLCLREREQLMALPSDEQDIDMGSVRAFMTSLGAPQTAVRVLPAADYQRAHELRRWYSQNDPDGAAHSVGTYLVAADVAVVSRMPAERGYHPVEVEKLAVHELAHGWNLPAFAGKQDGTYLLAHGFCAEDGRNTALEEGFAELLEAMYAGARYKELGQTTFYSQSAPNWARRVGGGKVADRWVKYMAVPKAIEAADGSERTLSVTIAPSAYAASILERIAEYDPDFLTVLYEARTSSDALGQVRERLNQIRPNLYETLMSVPPYTESSRRALRVLDMEVAARLAKPSDRIGFTLGALLLRGLDVWGRHQGTH